MTYQDRIHRIIDDLDLITQGRQPKSGDVEATIGLEPEIAIGLVEYGRRHPDTADGLIELLECL